MVVSGGGGDYRHTIYANAVVLVGDGCVHGTRVAKAWPGLAVLVVVLLQ